MIQRIQQETLMPFRPNGIYDLSERDYRGDVGFEPSISYSELKLMRESPLHFKTRKERPKKITDTMLLGTCVHAMLLTPSTLGAQILIGPSCDRRSIDNKKKWADAEDKAARCGLCLVSPDVFDEATRIAIEVEERTDMSPLRDLLRSTDMFERCVFFEWHGLHVKGRFDGYVSLEHPRVLWDLKTTRFADERGFLGKIHSDGYHLQAALYSRGMRELGLPVDQFFLVALESQAPYGVGFYRLTEEFLELAEAEMGDLILLHNKCREENNWPSYGITDLDAARWYKNRMGGYGNE